MPSGEDCCFEIPGEGRLDLLGLVLVVERLRKQNHVTAFQSSCKVNCMSVCIWVGVCMYMDPHLITSAAVFITSV